VLAGLIGAAANVGFILTVLVVMGVEGAGVSLGAGGWRWVLGICAFPALLTFFLRMFVPESEKWELAVSRDVNTARPGLAAIFTPELRFRTIMAAVVGGIALVGTWGSVQWIPVWVANETRNQDLVNLAQICSGVGAVLGTLAGAIVGQYVGRRVTYFTLCLGSLLICAFLFRHDFQLAAGPTAFFFFSVFLTGALTASFYGWLPLYLPELFPTRVRATGQGFGFNIGRIIAAVGALSTGVLVQEVFGGSFALAGATTSLIYLVGMAAIWAAPETHGKPLPE
jgi:MFS family permease